MLRNVMVIVINQKDSSNNELKLHKYTQKIKWEQENMQAFEFRHSLIYAVYVRQFQTQEILRK